MLIISQRNKKIKVQQNIDINHKTCQKLWPCYELSSDYIDGKSGSKTAPPLLGADNAEIVDPLRPQNSEAA
jgi:hypothetical protein